MTKNNNKKVRTTKDKKTNDIINTKVDVNKYIVTEKIVLKNKNSSTKKSNSKDFFTIKFNELLTKFIEEGHQQREITESTGISPASITQYKNGTSVPKGDILEKLALFFNVSSNYLLGKSDIPTYTFEDINKKIGLSQKAIETLYKLQHNSFDEDIDITEKKEISNYYSSQISILNLILEDNEKLLELLEDMKIYKEIYEELKGEKTKEKKETLEFYEYKLTKDFIYFVQKLERK